MSYTRLIPREDTYANWEQTNQDLAPNGLRLALGEMAAVIADPTSGALGLSNAAAQPGNPGTRLPNNGEIIFFKIGLGPNYRWDQLPVMWPMRQISVNNGRKLGTTQAGKDWRFVDPNMALLEVFKAPYVAPGASLQINPPSFTFEVGQPIPLQIVASVVTNTFRVSRARLVRKTTGAGGAGTLVGQERIATGAGTVDSFTEAINNFVIQPTDFYAGRNIYSNHFELTVVDDRPTADGGPNEVKSLFQVSALLPEFFGKSAINLRADPTKVAQVLASCTRMVRQKSTFQPGTIAYQGGEFCYYLLPKVGGALSNITDIAGIGQLDANGAFPPADVFEVNVDINGHQTPYLVYQSKSAYGSPILLNFFA
jgi:hypothetical protein